jgi:hypothetical protein
MKRIILLVFWALVFSSCKENEKPRSGFGELTITGIQMLEGGQSSTIENTWIHQFNNTLNLNFINEDGQSFQVTLNPNDFSKSYSIEMPFGNYTYSGNQSAGDFSEFIPLKIDGTFQLNQERQSIILLADTEYGLITIAQSNSSQKPIFISHTSSSFFIKENVFYSYVKNGLNTTAEITIDGPLNKFRTINQITEFQHHAKTIVKKDEKQIDDFQKADFDLLKETILLDEENKPLNLKPSILDNLDLSLNESSGLAFINNRLFSVNDEGNTAKIQEINPLNGSLLREISIENVTNRDWEDLAQSDTHLFVGDFGNNNGTRKDLNILKISISDLLNSSSVTAEKIEFSFTDQVDFSGSMETNNFDCEGFFYLDNQLHLFTKNWENNRTRHYIINDQVSNQKVSPIEEFDSQGLITGADISEEGNTIVLLGYENKGIISQSFIWLLSDFDGTQFFSGNKRKTLLGSPSILSQTEGVIFRIDSEILISGEKINFTGIEVPAKLSEINLTGLD